MKCRNEVRVEQKVPIAVAVKGRLETALNVLDHGFEKRGSVWIRTRFGNREMGKPDGGNDDDVGESPLGGQIVVIEENGADVGVEGVEDRETVPLNLHLRCVGRLDDRCCDCQ